MDAQQLDVVVRVAGGTLLLFLAAILVRDGSGKRLTLLFTPLAICLSSFLIGNTPDASLQLAGAAGTVGHLLSGYTAVFLWWFCLACFDRGFRLKGAVLAFGVAWFVVASVDRGMLGFAFAGKGLSWLLVALGFAIVAHLAWRLVADREGDLIEKRRNARILVVVLLGGQLLLDLSVDVIFGFDWRPRGFAIAQNVAILGFTLWLLALLLRANVDPLTFASRVVPAVSVPADERLAERLRTLIEVDRVHLDPEISFAAFARKMGATEPAVRHLVNHRLGHDHFRSFLNTHRVEEARRLLADPNRAGDKVIAIAMDSGFASLASFNRAFREIEGSTPSAYRDAATSPARTAF